MRRREAYSICTSVRYISVRTCVRANRSLGRPVAVEALLVFDNVGTIGFPRTGILRPLNFFKAQKDPGFDGLLRGDSECQTSI